MVNSMLKRAIKDLNYFQLSVLASLVQFLLPSCSADIPSQAMNRNSYHTFISVLVYQSVSEKQRRRKWQPIPVFLPGESQGRASLVGCHLWGRTESDTTDVTQQQQQQKQRNRKNRMSMFLCVCVHACMCPQRYISRNWFT